MAANRTTREELLANPGAANAAVADAIAVKVDKPVIALPPSDIVTLPGGVIYRGEVIRTAQVQELKGTHEEALARALQPPIGSDKTNWANFLTVLLECGTVKFGDLDIHPKELLKDACLGDRDALILAIRSVTYGDEVDLPGWQCPACGGQTDLCISLTDGTIEVVTLDDARKDSVFDVSLRKGRTASVRLATGSDLQVMYEQEDLTNAERESIMLSRCLQKITDADETEHPMLGRASAVVMDMSIPDRKAIVRAMEKHQPGPRYNEIKFRHDVCKKEVPLALPLGALFPDLF